MNPPPGLVLVALVVTAALASVSPFWLALPFVLFLAALLHSDNQARLDPAAARALLAGEVRPDPRLGEPRVHQVAHEFVLVPGVVPTLLIYLDLALRPTQKVVPSLVVRLREPDGGLVQDREGGAFTWVRPLLRPGQTFIPPGYPERWRELTLDVPLDAALLPEDLRDDFALTAEVSIMTPDGATPLCTLRRRFRTRPRRSPAGVAVEAGAAVELDPVDEGAIVILATGGADAADPESSCQVCGDPLATGTLHDCPACGTTHHSDCWDFNGGCSTFGCGAGR